MFEKEIVSRTEKGEAQRAIENTNYSPDGFPQLLFDLYKPRGAATERPPVVILIHGEAPSITMKNAGQYTSIANLLATYGIATVAFNHRMLVQGSAIDSILEDITHLRKHLENQAEEYEIDATRVGIWAFSGGMPFGFHHVFNAEGEAAKCIVGYYGPGDFGTLLRILPASGRSPTTASTITKSNGVSLPILIVRAGLDNPELNQSLDHFANLLLLRNENFTLCNHPTGNHAFDLINDNPTSIQFIELTATFLATHLKR